MSSKPVCRVLALNFHSNCIYCINRPGRLMNLGLYEWDVHGQFRWPGQSQIIRPSGIFSARFPVHQNLVCSSNHGLAASTSSFPTLQGNPSTCKGDVASAAASQFFYHEAISLARTMFPRIACDTASQVPIPIEDTNESNVAIHRAPASADSRIRCGQQKECDDSRRRMGK